MAEQRPGTRAMSIQGALNGFVVAKTIMGASGKTVEFIEVCYTLEELVDYVKQFFDAKSLDIYDAITGRQKE